MKSYIYIIDQSTAMSMGMGHGMAREVDVSENRALCQIHDNLDQWFHLADMFLGHVICHMACFRQNTREIHSVRRRKNGSFISVSCILTNFDCDSCDCDAIQRPKIVNVVEDP